MFHEEGEAFNTFVRVRVETLFTRTTPQGTSDTTPVVNIYAFTCRIKRSVFSAC